MKQTHGKARYKDGVLTITTQAKRGKKTVENVVTYKVLDIRPDPAVASPAYSLTKEDGEVYHCGSNQWGGFCDCPHNQFRLTNSDVDCKHLAACRATGLLPAKKVYKGQSQENS
jgi:hypothetical protein